VGEPLDHWTRKDLATGEDLVGIAFGNNTFIALTQTGNVRISHDMSTFTLVSPRPAQFNDLQFTGLAFGNGVFIAVTAIPASYELGAGSIFLSSDGIHWEKSLEEYGISFANPAFINGAFVVPASDMRQTWFLISADPQNQPWGKVPGPQSYAITPKIGFGNETDIATDSGHIYVSRDYMRSWTTISKPGLWSAPAYGVVNGIPTFVIVGDMQDVHPQPLCKGSVITSTDDGMTWSSVSKCFQSLTDVIFAGGHFVAVGQFGAVADSTDGKTWNIRSRAAGNYNWLRKNAFGNNIFVAVGDHGICTQSDPMDYKYVTVKFPAYGRGVVFSTPSSVLCEKDCSVGFPQNTIVILRAVPEAPGIYPIYTVPGRFLRWEGDCAGASDCKLTLNRDVAVTAHFSTAQRQPPRPPHLPQQPRPGPHF